MSRNEELEVTPNAQEVIRSRQRISGWVVFETMFLMALFGVLAFIAQQHFFRYTNKIIHRDYFWGVMTPISVMFVVWARYLIILKTDKYRQTQKRKLLNR